MSTRPAIPGPEDLLAHAGFIRAVARGMLLDPQRADDVVQETVLAALDAPPPRGGLRAWLAGIARNLSRSTLRSERRRAVRERAAARPEREPSAVDVAARLEIQQRLVEAVRALPEPYRAAIVLRFFDGVEPREIAERTGVPGATVRTRVHRGLAMLRERFDRDHGGDRRAWALALVPLATGREAVAATAAGTTTALLATGGAMTIQKAAVAVAIAAALAVAYLSLGVWSGGDRSDAPEGADDAPSGVDLRARADADPTSREDAAWSAEPDRDLDLFGVVLGATGEPLEGALVATFRDPWGGNSRLHPGTLHESVPGPTDQSAADGSFRVRLSRGEVVDLRVTAEGLGERRVHQCQAGERVVVSFGAGAAIEVVARDGSGSPVAGARFTVWREEGPETPLPVGRGTTAGDGRSVLEGLSPGRAIVLLIDDAHATPEPVTVMVPRSGQCRAEFVLDRGRAVRGRVTDAATGEPIPGARICESFLPIRTVVTDADGAYVFEHWGGAFGDRVYVSAAGYGPAAKRLPATGSTLDFALARGDEATGRVLDATGGPVAGARVGGTTATSTVTGADGRFHATGLRRGAGPHVLVFRALGHATLVLTVEPVTDRPGRIDVGDVVLPEARAVEGVVTGTDGEPLPRVAIDISRTIDVGADRPWIDRESRRTDDLGRFRFRDLSPGEYTLRAMPGWTKTVRREVIVAPDGDVTGLEIRITTPREPEDGSLTVRVLDPDRKPVRGVRVAMRGPGAPSMWPTAWTGEDGRARLTGLPDRHVPIEIEPPRDPERFLRKETRGAVPEGQEIEVVLVELPVVRGVVLGPDGGPLVGMQVSAVPSGQIHESTHGVTDAEGRFEVPLLPDTTTDLVVDGKTRDHITVTGRQPLYGEVRAVVAGTKDVTIRVAKEVTDRDLVVRVEDPEGRPVAGATVGLLGRGIRGASGKTGADGRFRASGLPRREIRCNAWRGEAEGLEDTVIRPALLSVVPAGQEVVLRFREGTELTGIVRDSTGRAVPEATVLIYLGREYVGSTRSDAEGRFRAVGLRGGKHLLSAVVALPERRQANANLEDVVPGAGEVELRFEVPVPAK